ncbi:MAG: hypothetical protein ACLQIB_18070, partial [Isosphaeraceae bacterium]
MMTRRARSQFFTWLMLAGALLVPATTGRAADVPGQPSKLELKTGDRIILIGNTLAERIVKTLPLAAVVLLAGCNTTAQIAAVVSGGAVGGATANPALGFAVGV